MSAELFTKRISKYKRRVEVQIKRTMSNVIDHKYALLDEEVE